MSQEPHADTENREGFRQVKCCAFCKHWEPPESEYRGQVHYSPVGECYVLRPASAYEGDELPPQMGYVSAPANGLCNHYEDDE